MKKIQDIDNAKRQILNEIKDVIYHVNEIIPEKELLNLEEGVDVLWKIRNKVYENINQLQHAALILKAVDFLKLKYEKVNQWYWHPFQTTGHQEPDLRGLINEKVLISAEITTSKKAIGTIYQRMVRTLDKLSTMDGDLYYIVKTEHMEEKAKSIINKNGYQINVINLKV